MFTLSGHAREQIAPDWNREAIQGRSRTVGEWETRFKPDLIEGQGASPPGYLASRCRLRMISQAPMGMSGSESNCPIVTPKKR